MTEPIRRKIETHLARRLVSALGTFAVALAAFLLTAESRAKNTKETPAEWPEQAPYNAAIEAFDAALTRAGWDSEFRQRLIKSQDSAKEAVAEVGNIKIPANKLIIFYEAQPAKSDARKVSEQNSAYTFVNLASESKSNENVHVFYLPPFHKDDRTRTYKYEDYFMCCYDFWKRQ